VKLSFAKLAGNGTHEPNQVMTELNICKAQVKQPNYFGNLITTQTNWSKTK
jgi:hypothetical protein